MKCERIAKMPFKMEYVGSKMPWKICMDSLTYSVRNFFTKTKVGASYRMSFIRGKIGINVCIS